ncbi:hypothetical protein [Indioceanicola profundi]|uniref:hypothetical protein n=1 Tax=Indioceanicola profundi TaxID=2220096 RepID=UPI000E6AAF13|nr:hypothetical protein [Indioceanicola profundi]
MNGWRLDLKRTGAAALTAIWLIAVPQSASAQWWEDEGAFAEGEQNFGSGWAGDEEDGLFQDEGALDTGEAFGGDDEIALGDEEDGWLGENDAEFGDEDSYGGYYEEDFETGEWGDWF